MPCGLVERPVDAEVDAALAVLLLACDSDANVRGCSGRRCLVVDRDAVQLVRHERERDVVAP
jgi:hypothetical protein